MGPVQGGDRLPAADARARADEDVQGEGLRTRLEDHRETVRAPGQNLAARGVGNLNHRSQAEQAQQADSQEAA